MGEESARREKLETGVEIAMVAERKVRVVSSAHDVRVRVVLSIGGKAEEKSRQDAEGGLMERMDVCF